MGMLVLVLMDVGLYCWGQGTDPALVPLELLVEGEWPQRSTLLPSTHGNFNLDF